MIIIKSEYFGTGERIKELIEQKVKTQPNFIEKFNEDPNYSLTIRSLSRWISGSSKPSKRNLKRTADILDCDLEYLECKANKPRDSKGIKIKLSKPSNELMYLHKIQELLSTTKQRFKFSMVPDNEKIEIVEGSYIDGEYRYYYEDVETQYSGNYHYEISINSGEWIKVSEDQLKDFVKRIMKYVCFELEQLKEEI